MPKTSTRCVRRCKHCGNAFYTFTYIIRKGGGKYCSLKCNYAHKAKLKRVCQHCRSTFFIYRTFVERGEGKYCSAACAHAASIRGEVRSCKTCGNKFFASRHRLSRGGGVYCSIACKNKGMSRKVACTCEVCGKDMLVQPVYYKRAESHYCSKRCLGIASRSLDYTPNGRRTVQAAEWRESVYKRDRWTCQICGAKSGRGTEIQAHHILPWMLYPKLRYTVSNGVTLCLACHMMVHKQVGRSRKKAAVSVKAYKEAVRYNLRATQTSTSGKGEP